LRIAVFNPKGGVGKTSISHSLFIDLDYDYITNDTSIVTKMHDRANLITGELPLKKNTIYDLGGFITPFISKLLKSVDLVVIPCINDYNSIIKAIEVLDFVGAKKSIVVANMLDAKEDLQEISEPILKRHKVKILPLKKSKAFKRGSESGNSLEYIYGETGLSKYNYKSVHKQYKKLLKELR